MLVNYWLLAFALLLLWFPRQWLRNGPSVLPTPRLRWRPKVNAHDPRDLSLRWREEFFKFRNWVDAARAGVGSWAVARLCFETVEDAAPSMPWIILAVEVLLLAVAIVVQTTRRERGRITLVAPVFFVMGLSFGLVGPLAAFFACVMVWTLNRTLPSAAVFLFAFAVMQTLFAYGLASAPLVQIAAAAMLSWLPALISALTHRRLERVWRGNNTGR